MLPACASARVCATHVRRRSGSRADGDTDAAHGLKVRNTIVAVCKTIWCKTSCWLVRVLNRASLTPFPTTSLTAPAAPVAVAVIVADCRRSSFFPFSTSQQHPLSSIFSSLPPPFSRPVDRLALHGDLRTENVRAESVKPTSNNRRAAPRIPSLASQRAPNELVSVPASRLLDHSTERVSSY